MVHAHNYHEKTAKETEEILIRKSSLVFHSYFDRDMETFTGLLDKNFVWIGSYEFQFTKGISEFIKITEEEQNEFPAQVYDEEYTVLSHEKHLWVVYGGFTSSAWKDETTFLYTRQRATFVWKDNREDFRLLHLHCTMARDVPLESTVEPDIPASSCKRWYDYMLLAEKNKTHKQEHILLKDLDGNIHYLLSSEILYISIYNRTASVCTTEKIIHVRQNLSQLLQNMPFLLQCHKSWLVNPFYISELRRYELTLADHSLIPVGKSRYNEVRRQLQIK